MDFNKQKFFIYILLITSMILWGTSFVWGKIALNYYNTYTIVFFRLFVSSLLLLPILLIIRKLSFPNFKDFHLFLILAFFEPFMYFVGETNGLQYLSPSIASVLISIIPLFTPFIAFYFLREKISVLNIIGIIISISGIIILVLGKNMNLEVNPKGLALMLVAIISANGYSVMIKKIPQKYSIFMVIFWQNVFGILYFLPLLIFTSSKNILGIGYIKEGVIAIINLGIFASTLAFLFYMYALKFMTISKVNVFTNTIPIFTIIISWLIYDETINSKKIIAIAIVVAGVIISQLKLKSINTLK